MIMSAPQGRNLRNNLSSRPTVHGATPLRAGYWLSKLTVPFYDSLLIEAFIQWYSHPCASLPLAAAHSLAAPALAVAFARHLCSLGNASSFLLAHAQDHGRRI
ncbi:hypothetical protein PsYK624_100300 [Phanerochaete sordida]|uniref:Uncharacterized protein n=1 Tax=Phanerochaete sordida TaxID=48140 RepID=A0A9P3LG24_9APHY|nr:hypothetical protein PsYK624_100300 [Phanerochaete sordida]